MSRNLACMPWGMRPWPMPPMSAAQLYLVQSEAQADGAALEQALGEMVPGYRDEEARFGGG